MPTLMTSPSPESMLQAVIAAIYQGEDRLLSALEELPAPIYITNADGILTHYNRACIAFAGRTPNPGEDNWCVTWRLYTDNGEHLPHDRCPMADAIRERRALRGRGAVAERPDGTRVRFKAYPTPLLDDNGEPVGGVNLLLEVTEPQQAQALRSQAARCRRLASAILDRQATAALTEMAAEYEQQALAVDLANGRTPS